MSLLAVAAGKLEFLRMVRGADDLLYTRLWNRFAALVGPPYMPKVAKAQKLEQVSSAVWLLEWEGGSGTAFALDGYDMVTCAHCADADQIMAHQPGGLVVKQYRVTVTHKDDHIDLARLRLDEVPLTALRKGEDAAVNTGRPTIVAGYGNYAFGSGIRLLNGHITGRGVAFGVNVMYSDHRAFAGNSGGPVLTPDLRVIGILQKASTPGCTGAGDDDPAGLPSRPDPGGSDATGCAAFARPGWSRPSGGASPRRGSWELTFAGLNDGAHL